MKNERRISTEGAARTICQCYTSILGFGASDKDLSTLCEAISEYETGLRTIKGKDAFSLVSDDNISVKTRADLLEMFKNNKKNLINEMIKILEEMITLCKSDAMK